MPGIKFLTRFSFAKLNAFADDHQVYYSHNDPAVLEECVLHDVRVANQWYQENGMLVNESKHQGLVLGETDFSFSFPLQETLEIFGMEIDKKLNFSTKHTYIGRLGLPGIKFLTRFSFAYLQDE